MSFQEKVRNMDLSIAYQTKENEIIVRKLTPHNLHENKILMIDEFSEVNNHIDVLFAEKNASELPGATKMTKVEPSRLNISKEIVEQIVYEDAKSLISRVKEERALKVNLYTIEDLTRKGKELATLYRKNRDVYSYYIWKLVSENIAASNVKVIFQTIESEDSKKLITKIIDNDDVESIRAASTEEAALFNDLKEEFGKTLHIPSYNEENKQLTITSTIGATKIIIMVNVWSFSALQKSILEGVFNSIKHFIQD